tara:strand:- start:9244 stop:10380 length:1137 start_codon:yes stop_codon:yes gene_type:complete
MAITPLTDQDQEMLLKTLGLNTHDPFIDIYNIQRNKTEIDKVYTMLFEAEGMVLKSALRDSTFCNYFRNGDNDQVGTSDGSVFSDYDTNQLRNVLSKFRNTYTKANDLDLEKYYTGYDKREYVCNRDFRANGKRGSLKTTLQMIDKLYQYQYVFDSSCGFHTHVSVNSENAYKKFMTHSFKGFFLDWYDYFSIVNNIQNVDHYKRIEGNERYARGTYNPLTESGEYGGSFMRTIKSYAEYRYEFIQCCYNLSGGTHFDQTGKRRTIEFRVFAPLKSREMMKVRMRSLNKMINAFLAYYKDIPANEIDTSEKAYTPKYPNFYYNGNNIGLRAYDFFDPIKRDHAHSLSDFRLNRYNETLQNELRDLNDKIYDNGFRSYD